MRRPPSSVPAATRLKLVPQKRTSVLIFAQNAIRSLPEDRSWSTPADVLSASTSVSTSPSNKRSRPFFRIFQENGLFFRRYPLLFSRFFRRFFRKSRGGFPSFPGSKATCSSGSSSGSSAEYDIPTVPSVTAGTARSLDPGCFPIFFQG